MALQRFFLTAPFAGGVLPLSAEDAHHARDVLRLRAGEEIVAVEPGGRQLRVSLAEVGDDVLGEPIEELPLVSEPRVVLFQGLPKGPKTDEIVQKAVEVGAEAVHLVVCERTVVRLDPGKAEQRAARWRKIAEQAAKQSQRAFVPAIASPLPLRDAERDLRALDHLLVAWEEAHQAPGIGAVLDARSARAGDRVGVLVGPEGGLTAEEVAWLRSLGAVPVSLGRTILRTETAGVVALALATYELGGLGGRGRE